MTTMTVHALAEAQQLLIDSRLETIERMLMGRVPRADRLAIVQEVELQIYELIGDRDPESMTSEDVVEILRKLDPPEAYLTNQSNSVDQGAALPTTKRVLSAASPSSNTNQTGGRIGGIMAICSFGLVLAIPILWLIAVSFDSIELLMIGLAFMASVGIGAGIAGLVMSVYNRRHGILPIVGIVTSSLALPVWLIGYPMFLLAQF